jgi:hypothetical protein
MACPILPFAPTMSNWVAITTPPYDNPASFKVAKSFRRLPSVIGTKGNRNSSASQPLAAIEYGEPVIFKNHPIPNLSLRLKNISK